MQKINTIVFLFVLLLGFAISPTQAAVCDVDSDGDVDRDEISLIFAARNTPVSGPDDPRDADGNGTINVLDGRQCALQCTLPNCTVNNPPTAVISFEPADPVGVGTLVRLDGSTSNDPDGDSLTYQWTLTPPPGSNASLDNPSSLTLTFRADVRGQYRVDLVVNDGTQDSEPDTAIINAIDGPIEPLVFEVDVNPDPVEPGGLLKIRIKVANIGSVAAEDLVVVFPIPTGLSFTTTGTVEPDVTGNCAGNSSCTAGEETTWVFDSLGVGESLTIQVNATVNNRANA